MTPIDSKSHLLREVLAKVGRNLLIFQQIELGLKVLIPITHPEGGAAGMEAYRDLKEKLKITTLGGLRPKLLEAVTADPPERFAEYIASVIESRNDLVHNFWARYGGTFATEDGLHASVAYLEKQLADAEPLLDLLIDIGKITKSHFESLKHSLKS